MNELTDNKMIEQIKALLENARQRLATEVNNTLLSTYLKTMESLVN